VKKSKQLIPQSGTKAQRHAERKSFLFFATFASFAPLREPRLSSTDYFTASKPWEGDSGYQPVFNSGGKLSTREAHRNIAAQGDCLSVTNDLAGGVAGDGVTPLKDGQWATLLQNSFHLRQAAASLY
jgi:hypothetical protein